MSTHPGFCMSRSLVVTVHGITATQRYWSEPLETINLTLEGKRVFVKVIVNDFKTERLS